MNMLEPRPRGRVPRAFKPFLDAQYRWLALALTMSLLGAGVWIVALVWQVIALGGTPIELSFVAAAGGIGMLGAALFGGVAADRIPQKWILVSTETIKVAVVGIVAFASLTGLLEVWHLAIAVFVLGVTEGFFYPAYLALLPAVLHADDLLAANGMEGILRPTVMQALGPRPRARRSRWSLPALRS